LLTAKVANRHPEKRSGRIFSAATLVCRVPSPARELLETFAAIPLRRRSWSIVVEFLDAKVSLSFLFRFLAYRGRLCSLMCVALAFAPVTDFGEVPLIVDSNAMPASVSTSRVAGGHIIHFGYACGIANRAIFLCCFARSSGGDQDGRTQEHEYHPRNAFHFDSP
jgi:hypothetical protein